MATFRYDPDQQPPAGLWNELDEDERALLVTDWHEDAGIEVPKMRLHATFHVIVENQVALGDETPVAQTVQRLMGEGLSRHDAIHAVANVMLRAMQGAMRDRATTDIAPVYYRDLAQLTAASWLASADPEPPHPRPRRKRRRFRP